MKDVIVKKSKIDKEGVFAARDFKKGDMVLKWNPKVIKKSEADKLRASQKYYLYPAGKNKYFLMQPPEKFANHSCEPNTRVKNRGDVAIKNIKKGEEITSDYRKSGQVSFLCKCGSKNCRRMIK